MLHLGTSQEDDERKTTAVGVLALGLIGFGIWALVERSNEAALDGG